jgi:S-adenosylmethionine:tRNA ribosyltransferase-isomerase
VPAHYRRMTEPRQRLTAGDFDYALPGELVAQHPAPERAGSRLLRLSRDGLSDHRFVELPGFLAPGDVLVFNDTRVIKARLFGAKDSGGRVEVLVERVLGEREALAQVRASKPPREGARLRLAGVLEATVLGRDGDLFRLRFEGAESVLAALDRHGAVPLPPYIGRAPVDEDATRYQTVYARTPGAVAAPTAGLHFDEPLLDRLRAKGVALGFVTLHVGAGTFQPVRVRDIADHRMHREWYAIPPETAAAVAAARSRGGSVVAVGTTSLRALEAAAGRDGTVGAGTGETELFITPGYAFRAVDRLITNFHLPKSTLLMLVAAFAGRERILGAYRHAIDRRYRFFSYGDAMLIDRIAG